MRELDLTVIILTLNEELHIKRCIDRIQDIAKEIMVIDCFSTDKTVELCKEYEKVKLIQHEWPGNQALQFNWVLDNVEIKTKWVLRLDADEYLLPDLMDELQEKLEKMPEDVSLLATPLARAFMGRRLKHGIVNGINVARIFRTGTARYENRVMDEQLIPMTGRTEMLTGHLIDDNRMPLSWFVKKHDNYAQREAEILLDAEYELTETNDDNNIANEQFRAKRVKKAKYARMPLFWRCLGYFFYRYIVKLGFLDGKEGFCWDFFQGLWYRMLVDAKVFEIKKACDFDRKKIQEYLQK